jgi:hypothetical protein
MRRSRSASRQSGEMCTRRKPFRAAARAAMDAPCGPVAQQDRAELS